MMLDRWRSNPISFIETVLYDPETKRPFKLLPAERAFLEHAFKLDDSGHLLYPEQLYSCPKKSGKTTFAGIHALTTLLLFGGSYPEATICANDQEQSVGRVFTMIRRIIESSPLLKREAKITQDRITFPAFDVTITAIPSNFATAAGGNQNISVFDELWAFTSERSRRLWDELVPPPTRQIACRLTTTYAGYEGESLLLQDLYRRGLQQPQIGDDLHAGDGILMFWSHSPVAPWQDERWLAEMRRTLRPNAYQRLVLNEFASAECQFVDMAAWDSCVQPSLTPTSGAAADLRRGRCSRTSVTAPRLSPSPLIRRRRWCAWCSTACSPPRRVIPSTSSIRSRPPSSIGDERFVLRQVLFDPFQMAAVSQRLAKAHVPIEEYPQTVPNLTAATSNLFDLIQSRSIALYPDAAMRLAVSRAIIVECIERLAARQVEAAAQDRRCGRVVDGMLGRGAWAGEARLRFVRAGAV